MSKEEKKLAIINIDRDSYTARTTLGTLYFTYSDKDAEEYFSQTLEDTVRPDNIKVKGETAIPGGVRCRVRPYTRPNGQETIIFYTEKDGVTLKWKELLWTYILAHGGNTHEDTDGCILVAKNRISKDKIQGAMTAELRAVCDELWGMGYEIEAVWRNLTQLS